MRFTKKFKNWFFFKFIANNFREYITLNVEVNIKNNAFHGSFNYNQFLLSQAGYKQVNTSIYFSDNLVADKVEVDNCTFVLSGGVEVSMGKFTKGGMTECKFIYEQDPMLKEYLNEPNIKDIACSGNFFGNKIGK